MCAAFDVCSLFGASFLCALFDAGDPCEFSARDMTAAPPSACLALGGLALDLGGGAVQIRPCSMSELDIYSLWER